MSHPQPESGSQPAADPAAQADSAEAEESAAPLNRAERRAQRRGKQAAPPQHAGPAPEGGRQPQPMLPPRRAGRRGNR